MKPRFSSTNLPADLRGKWILLGPSPEPEQGEHVKPARAEWSHAKGDKNDEGIEVSLAYQIKELTEVFGRCGLEGVKRGNIW